MKALLLKAVIMLLTSVLCLTAFEGISYGQTAADSPESSEYLAVGVFMVDSDKEFFVKNLDIGFVNATSLPFNTSMLAFNDRFRTVRFSVTGGGVFLRVSYDVTLDAGTAEAYGDDVLGEFRKAFNFSLGVLKRTYVINNETASVDVYYQLSGIAWNVESFEELAKYRPTEGFGLFVTRDLLSFYLQDNPNIKDEEYGIYSIEYNLTRSDQALTWDFYLSVGHRVSCRNEDHIDVDLNELLNHSGPIAPSARRPSQVFMDIDRREHSSGTPLRLSFSSSSPPCTSLKEENDVVTVTYDLIGSVDNIVVRINVAREIGFNLIYIAAITVAVSAVSVAVLLFVKARRRKLQKVKSNESSK